jgi:protein-tyrosine phosphatase
MGERNLTLQNSSLEKAFATRDMKVKTCGNRLQYLINANYGTYRGFIRYALGQTEYLIGTVDNYLHIDPVSIARLVFVCQGNINRSAFAAAVARFLSVKAISLGFAIDTGTRSAPPAIEVAKLFNICLDPHTATSLSDYKYEEGDLLCAMEIRHIKRLIRTGLPKQSICLLGHWARPHRIHIHDPAMLSREYFVTCFAVIYTAVTNLVTELRLAHSPCVTE